MYALIYDLNTGEFQPGYYAGDPEDMEGANAALAQMNQGLFENLDLDQVSTHYFDLVNSIRVRPSMETSIDTNTVIANGIDDFLITGLPVGVQMTATGPSLNYSGVETDGDFGFATVVAGVYTIKAKLFPYLDQQWEVTFA